MNESSTVLVITGAAATGKSTIGNHLRGHPGFLVIDGDVIGRGAAATSDGRRDYVEFWRYALTVAQEVRTNGLVPVLPCICLPEQVIAATTGEVVHFLALVSEPTTLRRRIADRRGVSDVPSSETHVHFDSTLRAVAEVPSPHMWTTYDVTGASISDTRSAGLAWAVDHLGRRPLG